MTNDQTTGRSEERQRWVLSILSLDHLLWSDKLLVKSFFSSHDLVKGLDSGGVVVDWAVEVLSFEGPWDLVGWEILVVDGWVELLVVGGWVVFLVVDGWVHLLVVGGWVVFLVVDGWVHFLIVVVSWVHHTGNKWVVLVHIRINIVDIHDFWGHDVVHLGGVHQVVVHFLNKGIAVDRVGVADGGYSIPVVVVVSNGVLLLFLLVDSLWVHILVPVVSGGGGGVVLEESDNWVDVLVEQGGLDKVLLEGGHGPVLLEVVGAHVPLEHWVAPVLTEEGKAHVFTEQWVSNDLVVLENLEVVGVIVDVVGWLVVIVVVDHVGVVISSIVVGQVHETLVGHQSLAGGDEVLVQGLAGDSGHQECGNNENFHIDWLQ